MKRIEKDCYAQWKIAEKRGNAEAARELKDLFVILVKNQLIVFGHPLHDN